MKKLGKSLISQWFSSLESLVDKFERSHIQTKKHLFDKDLEIEKALFIDKFAEEKLGLEAYDQEFESFRSRARKEKKSDFFLKLFEKTRGEILAEVARKTDVLFERSINNK